MVGAVRSSQGNPSGGSHSQQIVHNLDKSGFRRSVWHRTVGKLVELQRMCLAADRNLARYQKYMLFFRGLYASTKFQAPKKLILLLPSASDLMAMDPDLLMRHVGAIKRQFISRDTCDLRLLPNLYKELPASD